MGSGSRDKSRATRKNRHKPPPPPPPPPAPSPAIASDPIPNPNPGLSAVPDPDDPSSWGYCSEEQLEKLLLGNLELVYKEAISQLVSSGVDEAVAMKAILRSGHCYGSMDVLSNILHNARSFLGSEGAASAGETAGFSDLRHLVEYSLAGLVCLLQQMRPSLTRGDAMWCLLMAELHVNRAADIEIPSPEVALCKFHAQCSANQATPPRLQAAPAAAAAAAPAPAVASRSLPTAAGVDGAKQSPEELVEKVMNNLNLTSLDDEQADGDPKMAMVLHYCRQALSLSAQVKDRKEWAQQKALQAARKVHKDSMELRMLKAEKEENQRMRKGKQAAEDATMKKLADMEASLRKASGQVDKANAEVRRLETENAEIRAEMEAAKLSAAESAAVCMQAAKRERKITKRLQTWEKQKAKLRGEIAEEKRKVAAVERQLSQIKEAQKQAEEKWRKETKAKEVAISQVDEERRAKEAADAEIKRRQEALRQKIEMDFQRHKDDVQRLEEEFARLKLASSIQLDCQSSDAVSSGEKESTMTLRDAPSGSTMLQESSCKVNSKRTCVICLNSDVSVVLLPCKHQVLCINCNADHEKKKAKARCPVCHSQVEERIHIYGTSA